MVRTKDQFLKDVANRKCEIYFRGRRLSTVLEDEDLKYAAYHTARLFDYPKRTYFDESLNLEISKYYKIPRSSHDLLERHLLIYDNTIFGYGLFNISQAIGSDALFALLIVSKMIDKKYGTDYYSRVWRYYQDVVRGDLTIAVAQTDVKGHRKKRPFEQPDPDLYLRVVETKSNGIVVRGAKAHTTHSVAVDEIIVLPTRAMSPNDKNYAVAFAIPVDTPGLKLIVRETGRVSRTYIGRKEGVEPETLTVFDDVFVPWDRVFMYGEYDYAGLLAITFATYHRFTAVSYRAALANLYLGAAYKMAEANGVLDAKHIRDDILEIVIYKEIQRMGALAAAMYPLIQEGIAIPNPVYTNIAKLYSNSKFSDVLKAVVDVAGGIIATFPTYEDLQNEITRKYVSKYMQAAIDGERRIKLIELLRDLVVIGGGWYLTTMMHAEGSMEASKLELFRSYDYKEALELVERLLEE
ncbi:4-hydroxyphenylacetate 3-hydroxylase N-terminal domain-containing protein [Pyrobaculum aerophilum]|uniref:4-hydroxyphenylacetate 3-hydroxylase N-terminal domain-containing protein n=1 Tax=Pyrobaculum aerophilum TaxID=13773 RepID=UPI0023F2253E|nr:4-hydroxyphenylacetate 3-hydroxylase N-terminal domain-containing protein [Pyrobaculum aerophilum]MCX8137320.1 4-hydroxybutyryl-CoA dehydratase [Pyrobaculum aerophilum]